MKKFIIDFTITFIAALIVTAAVSYLYSLILHGNGIINWGTAFSFAIVLGIVVPWINYRKRNS